MSKAHARFSIGIDLGTTNSALAFAPLVGEGTPEILVVPQWESLAGLTEEPTLPSFLYLPEEAAAAYFRGKDVGAEEWVVGRFARIKASETPGRVVHSAKSWLCHHAADRSEPFLPWGSTDLAREQKISPVRASALILNYVRGTWNSRFGQAGFAFDDRRSQLPSPLPSMRRHSGLRLPPPRKRASQKTCDYWRSRRLRSIAGWRNTTRHMTCGSGPTVTIPICGTYWSSISAVALQISAFSNCA